MAIKVQDTLTCLSKCMYFDMFEWKTEQGINNTFSQTVTQFPFKHQP